MVLRQPRMIPGNPEGLVKSRKGELHTGEVSTGRSFRVRDDSSVLRASSGSLIQCLDNTVDKLDASNQVAHGDAKWKL